VQSSSYCAANSPGPFSATYHLCTIDPVGGATGTCHGDSGGPLVARNAAGSWTQIGITSFGDADCDTTVPSYFTRVDSISSWVSATVRSLQPGAASAPAATTTVPTATPTPTPTTPADGLRLSIATARADVRTALRLRLGASFRGARRYRSACWSQAAARVACDVSWDRGATTYWGRVTIVLGTQRGRVVWGGSLVVRRASSSCLAARPRRRCPTHVTTG